MANGQKVLLGEGTDDEHVLKHICGNRDIPHLDEVEKYGSVEKLIESIGVRLPLLIEEGDVVGIVIDADTEISDRWKSIRNRIVSVGFQNVPDQPAPDGTILDPPAGTYLPRLGVWVMPNNQTSGILEDFLHFLVPQPNILFDHARDSVAAIPEGERRFKQLYEPKAVIHTWLAWQEDPGRPFGTAITANFLDPNVQEAGVLADWLKRLFFPSSQSS